jgi:hypothetical protein
MDYLLALEASLEKSITDALQQLWRSWHRPWAQKQADLDVNNH